MPIASDGQGNFVTLGADGQWTPAKIAANPETGTKMVLDGADWKPLPGSEPSMTGSAVRGAVKGVTFGFGDELGAAGDALERGIGNLIHGSDGRPTMGQEYDRSLARRRETDRQDMATNPVSSAVGQVGGGVLGALATGGAAEATGLTAAATRVAAPLMTRLNPLGQMAARYAGAGALGGAVTGFGEGEGGLANRAENAAVGAGTGAAAGLAVGGATGAAGRILSPVRAPMTAERQALIAAAGNEGIPLSVGQQTGSRTLKNVEGALAQLPGSSGGEAAFAETQARAFNRAALTRVGENADIASPDVLNRARARIGGVINDVANRNVLQMTPQLATELTAVEDSLRFLPAETAAPVRARLEQLRGMMLQPAPQGANMTIPGASYRMLDSQLSRSIRSTSDGDLRAALGDLRGRLRAGMDASISPEDSAAWREANRQYANLMVIKDAVSGSGAGAAEGHISQLALKGALQRSTGRGAAWGQGDLLDLANLGQGVLRQPPDSGTAGRSQMHQLLTGATPGAGGGVIGGVIGGPAGAAVGMAVPYVLPRVIQEGMRSRAGRAWLTNGLGANLHGPLSEATAAAMGAQTRRNRLGPD